MPLFRQLACSAARTPLHPCTIADCAAHSQLVLHIKFSCLNQAGMPIGCFHQQEACHCRHYAAYVMLVPFVLCWPRWCLPCHPGSVIESCHPTSMFLYDCRVRCLLILPVDQAMKMSCICWLQLASSGKWHCATTLPTLLSAHLDGPAADCCSRHQQLLTLTAIFQTTSAHR